MTKYRKRIIEELTKIIGKKIISINHVCDLICVNFENDYSIHSQALIRFLKGNKVLFTRSDYFAKENDDINSKNNYEINSKNYIDIFIGNRVVDIKVNEIGDCFIKLENNVKIDIYINVGKENFYDCNEQYRIFKSEEKHLVVYDNKKIELL
jgi:hypothetical protein